MTHETIIRLSCFIAILVAVAVWEALAPRRPLTSRKTVRWFSNFGIVFLNSVLVKITFSLLPVGLAQIMFDKQAGLLNIITLPFWLKVLLAVLILDFVIYLQHVMFHALPVLWRFHMMHHADLDIDVSTGLRFHPVEIGLSMGIKLGVVVLLGPPAVGVLIFEILLNGTSLFNHGNIRMPAALDRFLRLWIVTPDMHRVHHSVDIKETNSNFGFNLPWWDRLFGTYKAQPKAGHKNMTVGLSQFRDQACLALHWLLVLPFLRKTPRHYSLSSTRDAE